MTNIEYMIQYLGSSLKNLHSCLVKYLQCFFTRRKCYHIKTIWFLLCHLHISNELGLNILHTKASLPLFGFSPFAFTLCPVYVCCSNFKFLQYQKSPGINKWMNWGTEVCIHRAFPTVKLPSLEALSSQCMSDLDDNSQMKFRFSNLDSYILEII